MKATTSVDYVIVGPCVVDIRICTGSKVDFLQVDVEPGEKLSVKEL